jgi:PIN domain nuclease of toxin-antitoxin system
MRLLVDTHTFLWWHTGDRRLPGSMRELIETGDHDLLLSVASVWEMVLKVARGRLRLGIALDRFLAEVRETQGFIAMPIEQPHALAVLQLPDHHKDPFDRMIVAQARVEGLPIVTRDPNIRRYDVETIW